MKYLKADLAAPPVFQSCGQFISDGPWKHSRRTIDSFEVIVGVRGTAYIEQDGIKHEVGAGNALLLLPGIPHMGYEVSREEVSFFWMHFLLRGGSEILEIQPGAERPGSGELAGSIWVPAALSIKDPDRLMILCRQLLHSDNARYYTPYVRDYLMMLVLIELTQQSVGLFRGDDPGRDGLRIDAMLEWLRIHLDRELSVKEIAGHFGFNPDYLVRWFRKHTGMTVRRYINSARILKAKQLLGGTSLGIKEIAYSLGFRDEKYFMKLFRQSEGLTPTEYRNSYPKTHLNNR